MITKYRSWILWAFIFVAIFGFGFFVLQKNRSVSGPSNQRAIETGSVMTPTVGSLVFEGQLDASHRPRQLFVTTLDGKTVRTVSVPADFIGGAGSLQIVGTSIYYLSGTERITSIGRIDPATGATTIFAFTKTDNTNVGNSLSAMTAWAVSPDETHLAWMDTDGKVTLTSIGGLQKQEYQPTNKAKPLRAWIGFGGDGSLMIWRFDQAVIRRIQFNEGSQSTISLAASPFDLQDFGVSSDGNSIWYALTNGDGEIRLRDLVAGTDKIVGTSGSVTHHEYDFAGATFSSDRKKLLINFRVFASDVSEAAVVDVATGAKTVLTKGPLTGVGAVNGEWIFQGNDGTYQIPLDGGEAKKLSSEWYLGTLNR